ncbi:hypothetical protein BU25DRAFT_416500 [Macroventuria anomochaeta]|uniref:Uncharacterized protein n=1 Tax=Macroventuria anomochaeta TaxID=301207 RepID=A0ACB6SFZ8_9PLEO|nr:uncharacterized protein BU25DRAFT_416500 [Macroventuria anomochaeta]KAF2633246.1 hypothetical protein BU25DRAFT_416500 [Macroventuria anomochaeta]
MRSYLLLAGAIGAVSAFPAEVTLEARAVNCAKVPATSTITTTTALTSTVVTSTATVTTTSSACPVSNDEVCNGLSGANCPAQKRAVNSAKGIVRAAEPEAGPVVNILPLLAAFAQAKISEGCSCLNIKLKATTTFTATAPPATTKIVSTTTACTTACTTSAPPVHHHLQAAEMELSAP